MRPFNDIHIGDVYQSVMKFTGNKVNYTVVAKDMLNKNAVKVRPSYQHPAMAETVWMKINHRIFNTRIVKGHK